MFSIRVDGFLAIPVSHVDGNTAYFTDPIYESLTHHLRGRRRIYLWARQWIRGLLQPNNMHERYAVLRRPPWDRLRPIGHMQQHLDALGVLVSHTSPCWSVRQMRSVEIMFCIAISLRLLRAVLATTASICMVRRTTSPILVSLLGHRSSELLQPRKLEKEQPQSQPQPATAAAEPPNQPQVQTTIVRKVEGCRSLTM
jgi:hypothetical protein